MVLEVADIRIDPAKKVDFEKAIELREEWFNLKKLVS